MILDAVSLADCLVFVVFLIPQLLIQAGPIATFRLFFQITPFLLTLPSTLIRERVRTPPAQRSPFVQSATVFQDIVIRCVRYAFAHIDARIGRVFFSKPVAYPFLRFRMLRNGFLTLPFGVHEVAKNGVKGLWLSEDLSDKPDVCVFYCHGGGFAMGSAYFYLEFLLAWLTQLQASGFRNPAIFALEYTLVPDGVWPQQFKETSAAYKMLVDFMGDGSKICVAGDSAGATLVLSRLLHHGNHDEDQVVYEAGKPGLALLISPWTHLVSPLNRNTLSDYLDTVALERYGRQYAGRQPIYDGVLSPGLSNGWWKRACPASGYCIVYGEEEVFAPGIKEMMNRMRREGARVKAREKKGAIHAWPVVDLFLGRDRAERLGGLDLLTDMVVTQMGVARVDGDQILTQQEDGKEKQRAGETVRKRETEVERVKRWENHPSTVMTPGSSWTPLSYFHGA